MSADRQSPVRTAFVDAQISDGQQIYGDHALLVGQSGDLSIVPAQNVPAGYQVRALPGGVILPGFVDLQANGGGGVMFNDDQSVAALRTIAQAHASIGTNALLPTLITDNPERTQAAIAGVRQAIAEKVAGIVGIHLEGPHLSASRKGAHDASLIRPMTDTDLRMMLDAAETLPNVMVTVAPENTTLAQVTAMADAGILVSLGHSDADFATCMAYFDAGARCATHLFNAMSQLGNREPGLVGAVLARDDVYAGLIADGIHVHPSTIAIALRAKPNPEQVFLVTDAMSTAGSEIDHFMLNGRRVLRQDQRLTLSDGTLAGADLEMARALSVMTSDVGAGIGTTIPRATATPASLLREPRDLGRLTNADAALYYQGGAVTRLPL